MSKEHNTTLDPRVSEAVQSLQSLILNHYPTATFTSFQSDDPEGTYLRAGVDVDDPDEVMDLAINRLLGYQLEQDLPIYLLPVRTDAGIAATLKTRKQALRPLAQIGSR